MFFNGPENPQNYPFPRGDIEPIEYMVSLAHLSHPHTQAFRLVQQCLQGSQTWPTDTQTGRPCYSICSNSART